MQVKAERMASCPFCGATESSLLEYEEGCWAVTCSSCGAIGPAANDQRAAAGKWDSAAIVGKALGQFATNER